MSPQPTETATRTETDTFGPIEVPADRYWGAQTQRSMQNFRIGGERMPPPLVHALGIVKQAAAAVNMDLGQLDPTHRRRDRGRGRTRSSQGKLDDEFPLVVWQTGSGTQSNMNANEVIANRAIELLGGERRLQEAGPSERPRQQGPVLERHLPDRHAHRRRRARSRDRLLPALTQLHGALDAKAKAFADIIKIGRTHLQDATPLTLGQEFSGYAAAGRARHRAHRGALPGIYALAQGGTAVGTGLNAQKGFAETRRRARSPRSPACPSSPRRTSSRRWPRHDAMVDSHGALKTLAAAPVQDRQRHPPARLGPALGPRRADRCRRTSPAPRSCRARSTRPSARR